MKYLTRMGVAFMKRDDIPGLGPGNGRALLLELGPVFFALAFNYLLLGALLVQTYNYYLAFKRDSNWLKLFVYTVVILDLVQTGMSTYTTFHTFVIYYGHVEVTQNPPKTIMSLFLFGGLVGGCVQMFYAWRIWTLTKSLYKSIWFTAYVVVVVLTSILSTVCAVTASALDVIVDDQVGLYGPIFSKLLAIWFSAALSVDVLIAIAMVFIVSSAKTNTSFKRTQNVLEKILLRAVATGVITALLNILEIPLFFAWPNTDLGEILGYIGGKVYSNTLLVTLNARYTDSDAFDSQGAMTSGFNSSPTPEKGSNTLESLKFTPNSIKLETRTGIRAADVSGHTTNGTISSSDIESKPDIHDIHSRDLYKRQAKVIRGFNK